MKKILHPSLTLGARRPFLKKTEGNLARIDMILHTNIGDLPWNPEFGCDLTSLVGEAATPERIDHTESEVRRSIATYLPDVNIKECIVQLHSSGVSSIHHREALIPVAESALVSMGTEARLELKLDLELDDEVLEIGTEIGFDDEE